MLLIERKEAVQTFWAASIFADFIRTHIQEEYMNI